MLADGSTRSSPAVAERAAADREWTYGHLVVDEAQELSAMDWHVLARRCPSRSITAVGDLAQRSAPAGARAWADVLAPVAGDRFTLRPLTVNYRTPAEIMEAAALALPADERHRVPQSVRRTGEPPRRAGSSPELVAEIRARWSRAGRDGCGTAAVITRDPAALPDLGGPPTSRCTPRARRRASSSTWWPWSTRTRSGRPARRPLRRDDQGHPDAWCWSSEPGGAWTRERGRAPPRERGDRPRSFGSSFGRTSGSRDRSRSRPAEPRRRCPCRTRRGCSSRRRSSAARRRPRGPPRWAAPGCCGTG